MTDGGTTRVWRIDQGRYAETAFSGIGAQRDGGRFNSAGTAVVYTADSCALALFEVRVHVPTFRGMRGRVVTEAEIDDDLIETLHIDDLPADWQVRPAPRSTQVLGDTWVVSGRSAVLRVPSVVVPGHVNHVLNPAHPDFARIRIGVPQPLSVDPRLIEPDA